ncbi:bifunctional UDP-sugar hydrolase/5'-nucleotidase [Solobacterium moorei]|uniref:bifunctional metallophosphatase/5'-nucleotidase n=1 Tax=Solobacterium moorei TaxID=102148 RepID=UPI0028D8E3F1|nr:bifunctional UDP-sugar hydrolase/5'-nucleotidase [Solobacterium moorei]
MKYNLKKYLSLMTAFFLVLLLLPIRVWASTPISILYTNDVHCGLEGYSKLAAYRQSLTDAGISTVLVDAGDHVQGELIGTMDQGESIIDIMNQMNYDYAVPGNHEFDYKVPQFLSLMNRATFKYLSANFKHADGTDIMDAYAIKEIDGHKIGFVGICTPESYTKSTPVYFQDASGNYVYTFSEDTFYATIQAAVDAAKAAGAEAIVAIGHTGMDGSTEEWTTKAIIENTNGIDAYIDGHSHEVSAGPDYTHMENGVLQHYSFFNKDGKQVFYTQTGTKLKNFGELKIEFTPTVQVTSVMHSVADLTDKDSTIEALITNARQRETAFSGTEIGTSEVKLFAKDDDGTWLVRHQETNLGDYNADAYLWRTGADIALMNAGGVRTNVNVGTVTKKDLISVNPWMNQVGVIEATGQTILDALEHGARFYPNNNGGYLQVAGLTYEINTKVTTSPVVEDSKGSFLCVDPTKPRRVQNVLVCGEPIDPNRTYRVAGTFYILQYSGDGMSMFKNCPVISGDYPSDAEVLIEYMTQKLNGVISAEAYGNKDGNGRIKVVDENRFVEVERVEPTHSAPGYIKYVCEIDGTEKYEELPKLEYTFLEGENGEWAGTDDVLKFRINGDETDLQNVLVDGVLLTRGTQYTVRHGSTIIELTPSYLQTLSVGSHTMTVVYTNGSVSTTFSVRRAVVGSGRTVATSDNSRVQMWSIACMIALMSLLVSAYYRIKKA